MSQSVSSYRLGAVVVVAGGLAGAAVAAYGYVTPLTGITGTAGALLVIVSSILVVLAGLVLALIGSRGWRNLLRVLIGLGILGTAVAGMFLHALPLALAMIVAAVGLAMDCLVPARAARGTKGAIA